MKEDLQQNPKMFLRTIQIIHLSLLVGPALFAFIVYSKAIKPVLKLKPGADTFFYLVPVFVFVMAVVGRVIRNKKISEAAGAGSLKEKIAGYQTAMIIAFALSEGATLFAVVVFLITNNLYYLIIAGVNILYFLSLRPTREKVEEDLNLSYGEKLEL